jgi:hypothetical protein
MKARKVMDDKLVLADGRLIQRLVWQLPEATAERPHGLKYRLYCGREGRCIVRYDNETGKGDHVHYGEDDERHPLLNLPLGKGEARWG